MSLDSNFPTEELSSNKPTYLFISFKERSVSRLTVLDIMSALLS